MNERITDFDSEMIKNWSNFDKTRDKETQFFSSAAEYFGLPGRIILERVGNTALDHGLNNVRTLSNM